jgi:hypothetical protein
MELMLGAAVATAVELAVVALLLGWRPTWHHNDVPPMLATVRRRRIGEVAPGR